MINTKNQLFLKFSAAAVSAVFFSVSCAQIGLAEKPKQDNTAILALAAAGMASANNNSSSSTSDVSAQVPMEFIAAAMPVGNYTAVPSTTGSSVQASSVDSRATTSWTIVVSLNSTSGKNETIGEFTAGTYVIKNSTGTVMFTVTVTYNGGESWTVTATGTVTPVFGTIKHNVLIKPSGFVGSCYTASAHSCINYYSNMSGYDPLAACIGGTKSTSKCDATGSVGACSFYYNMSGYSSGWDYVFYSDYASSVTAFKQACDTVQSSVQSNNGFSGGWTYNYRP
jgi:hypothetical protein